MPIAPEGSRIIVAAAALFGALAFGLWFVQWSLALLPLLLWIGVVLFFRDPRRVTRCTQAEYCAPADGRIADVTFLDEYPRVSGACVRIGTFLSLFDVHINRAPCSGRVREVVYQPGRFRAAYNPEAAAVNESNTIVLERNGVAPQTLVVRQVAGVVARRIVCSAKPGDEVVAGERIGLIRFGSRTELILPMLPGTEVLVGVGERVRAGQTIIARHTASVANGPQPTEKRREDPQVLAI